MSIFIALIRGINVSGHNKLKMTDLSQLFINEGFINVKTYIQSGNVIFESKETNTTEIELKISNAIEKKFGYLIQVLVLPKNELETIFNSNPFIKQNSSLDITKLHVTILKSKPDLTALNKLKNIKTVNSEEFILIDKTVYLHCPNGYGNTKLNNNVLEKKLNTAATTRNWKTITKLVTLSK